MLKLVTIIPFVEEHHPEWRPDTEVIYARDTPYTGFHDSAFIATREHEHMLYVGAPWGDRNGFGATVDAALVVARRRGYDVALVWNSDAELHASPDDFLPFFEKDRKLGLLAPAKLMGPTDRPSDPDGELKEGEVCVFVVLTEHGPLYVSGQRTDPIMDVIALSYCPLYAVRLDCYFGVGGYDRAFAPGFFEDADLWIRARRLGWKTRAIPSITYTHGDEEGGSKSFMKVLKGREGCEQLGSRNLSVLYAKYGISGPLGVCLKPYVTGEPWPPLEEKPAPTPAPAHPNAPALRLGPDGSE